MRKWSYLFVLMATVMALFATHAGTADKVNPEDIIARHLEAIGSAETLASVKSMIAGGTATANFQSPRTGQFTGKAVLASDGRKSVVGMIFEDSKYSLERFSFDGDEVTASYIKPGLHSTLGDFLTTHKGIVKQGIVGGALSTAWPLRDPASKAAKLEYGGTKKIGDRTAHEVRYLPRGGSDLEIKMYFDTENYHHLRTEYTRVITAQIGTSVDSSASQRQSRYKMVEDFSDFQKAGAFTLPHRYKLTLETDAKGGAFIGDWEIQLTDFNFNQRIPPDTFKTSAPN